MGATVLVVDDEPILLHLLTRVLERAGYCVLTCEDGSSALATFEKSPEPVQVLVVDYLMRPQGGASIVRELRSQAPELGVIVTSGSGPDAQARSLLDDCGGRFIRKPFAPESLLQAVDTLTAAQV